jgi:hypothetical protein
MGQAADPRKMGAVRTLRLCLLLSISAALLVTAASPATADDSLNPCEGQAFSQPFLPWLDLAEYTLAPNGTFEQGAAGWTLAGGAALAAGNEPYDVHGASDRVSLSLPSGSSATSSEMCVSLLHPTVRFFVRNSGSPLAALRVDVLYRNFLGLSTSTPIGVVTASPDWQPTLPLLILDNLTALPLVTNGTVQVAFRFTPIGAVGALAVDDVYVDPYQGR